MRDKIFSEKLKAFLHDPIDKCFDIKGHEERAKKYAGKLGVSNIDEIEGPDHIASCMERSLLPKEKVYQEFNKIRHSLSEKEIDISKSIPEKNEIFNLVESVFANIKSFIFSLDDEDKYKAKFFYLWRNLQEELFENLKDKPWAKYLSILPADTRIPDHSIWEHLKIASAVNAWLDKENGSLIQNNSLFLFTIGPVQSLISQARKTRDFYMGSFILSFLTFKAMEVIIENYGPTNIIYPDLYKQPLMDRWMKKNLNITPKEYEEPSLQLPTIPNKFAAILPETNYEEIKKIAEDMKVKIEETVKSAIDKIFGELKINEKITDEVKNKIHSQLSQFPKSYWVAVPWKLGDKDISHEDLKEFFEENLIERYKKLWDFAEKNGEHLPNIGFIYELLYSTLEKSMGARKNVRSFAQPLAEEKGRKCAVCGERDIIFFRKSKNENKLKGYNPISIDLNEIDFKYLSNGEGLCAICFLKRTFDIYLQKEVSENAFRNLTFPSTAEVACADWKKEAIENAKSEFERYIEKLKEVLKDKFQEVNPLPKLKEEFKKLENPEGEYFYEENIDQKYFEKEFGISISAVEIDALKKCLKTTYENKKVNKPKSYYAIIHLDADNMGKWLSGEFLPNIEYAYNSHVWGEKIPDNFKKQLKEILHRKHLTPSIHASISTALRNYTLEFVRKIVEEKHLGKLVYAGGDDVLAFVNLKDVFDIMNKLRWAFSGNIKIEDGNIVVNSEKGILIESNGFVEKDGIFLLTMGPHATASAGVVIAHYKTPLQIVIRKVFEMEKKAKENGKDAFSICLMRRSGEERVFEAKWSYEEDYKKTNTIELVNELVKAFDKNSEDKNGKEFIAKSFIQKMEDEFLNLKDDKGFFKGYSAIFDTELWRLLDRSYNKPKDKKLSKEEEKKLKKDFLDKINKIMKELFWRTGGNINNLLNICKIGVFISEAED